MTLAQVALSQLAIWGAWSAFNSIGIRFLLDGLYACPIRALRLKRPPPQTPAARSHWEVARILVACLYVLYCLYRAMQGMETNIYAIFGVLPTSTDKDIKRHYRELAKVYHPDKVGATDEGQFMRLHNVYSILSDSVLRYAYDRFGVSITSWRNLSTLNEYMREGIQSRLFFHFHMLISHVLAWVLSLRSESKSVGIGSLWGILLQGCLFFFQMSLLVSVPLAASITKWTYMLPFQLITLTSELFFPCLLLLQQLNVSLNQLMTTGRKAHFQRASSKEPVYVESMPERSRMQLEYLLRKEPETLTEAKEQTNLLLGTIMQLHERLARHATVPEATTTPS